MTYVILFRAIMKSIVGLIILVCFYSANVAAWDWGDFFCSFLWCVTPTAVQPQAKETNNTNVVHLNKLNKKQSFKCVSRSPYHTWYQAYRNEQVLLAINIGNIHFDVERKDMTTQFILTVEAFDNDSEIQCYKKKKVNNIWNLQVFGTSTDKDMEEYDILKYNEKHNVSYEYMKSCYESYNNKAFLGVINTTSNQIKIYNMTMEPPKFDKTHNGSILCCIIYKTKQTSETEGRITRYVEQKTLLVYNVTHQQDSLEDTENVLSVSTTEDAKGTDVDTHKEDANLDSQHAKPVNQYAVSGKSLTIYIVPAVAGALILLVVVIIIKRCRKNPKSKVEAEPRVLYAELDLLRQHESGSLPKEGPEEESPYTEIIGEIRSQ